MAKLYFYYASMNAGKSTVLLQASFNYQERGIASRIGLSAPARLFDAHTDLFATVAAAPPDCVLVDEAQFLGRDQVWQLARVADDLGIPVLCYGLRTDFLGNLFPGSQWLLAIADTLTELKAVCACGRKATMNLRIDAAGKAVASGAQTEIGGNDRYVALCRRHFVAALAGQHQA
jgi:thymidine kinase